MAEVDFDELHRCEASCDSTDKKDEAHKSSVKTLFV